MSARLERLAREMLEEIARLRSIGIFVDGEPSSPKTESDSLSDFDYSIDRFNLSRRTHLAIQRNIIYSARDLRDLHLAGEAGYLRNVGKKGLAEIAKAVTTLSPQENEKLDELYSEESAARIRMAGGGVVPDTDRILWLAKDWPDYDPSEVLVDLLASLKPVDLAGLRFAAELFGRQTDFIADLRDPDKDISLSHVGINYVLKDRVEFLRKAFAKKSA